MRILERFGVGAAFAPAGAAVAGVATDDMPLSADRAEHTRLVGLDLIDHIGSHRLEFV